MKTPPPSLRKASFGSVKTARGFSLIEMLVSVAIVSVLAALAMTGFGRITENARMTKCANNLRQIGQGFQLYMADNDGKLPTYESVAGSGGTNWQERIAPYLVGNKGTTGSQRFNLRTLLMCPSDKLNGVVYGVNKFLTPEYRSGMFTRMLAIQTKRSDTLLVGENYTADIWYIAPSTGKVGDRIDYRHKAGNGMTANFLFADFHVESLSYKAATERGIKTDPYIAP